MIHNILNYLKNRQLVPVLISFIVCLFFISLPPIAKITLSRLAASSIYFPFLQTDIFFTDVVNSKSNNVLLNEQLTALSLKVAGYSEDHYENSRLRRMLNFDLQIPYELIPAEVIGIKPRQASQSLMVNAGASKGIDRNMPVVCADGIVGKTIEVTENQALVQLLIDHNCRVSAINQRTRAMGIIRWTGGKYFSMGDVPIESDVALGDSVVSSGLGGIFPAGLIVGVVEQVSHPEGSLFKDISVKPNVDFSSIEEVFIVVHGE